MARKVSTLSWHRQGDIQLDEVIKCYNNTGKLLVHAYKGNIFAADLIPPPNIRSPNSEFGEFDPPITNPILNSVNSGIKNRPISAFLVKNTDNLKEFGVF